jgi:ubiquinone biosynthesis protein
MLAVSTSWPTPRRRFRLVTAYRVFFRILSSYLGVAIVGRLRGEAWVERRLPAVHRANARRVERAILELEGLFIKLGQLLSILSHVLPEELRSGLETLQDRVTARPFEPVRQRIELELGAPIGELFAELDPVPIASASLAQVHAARLADGRRVAVKVQHVGIEEIAQLDLRAIRRMFQIVQRLFGVRGLEAAVREIEAVTQEELDFGREADHIEEISGHLAALPGVGFPAVVRERSSQRVLTTTFVEGTKVTQLEALAAAGVDREELATRVLTSYCEMIFRHGVYHADPHPGNLFVQADGTLVFVDFGAVGRLSPRMREGIPRFLEAVLGRNQAGLLEALRQMGFVTQRSDLETAERVIGYFQRRFLEQVSFDSWNLSEIQIDPRLKLEVLGDLRELDVSWRELSTLFDVPREWVLLERTLHLLVGLCTFLAPGLNPMSVARPYVEKLALGDGRDWSALLARAAKELLLPTLALPEQALRLLERANRGELAVRLAGLEGGVERIYALGHQLIYAAFALVGGIGAVVARSQRDGALAGVASTVGGLALAALVASMVRAGRRDRRR